MKGELGRAYIWVIIGIVVIAAVLAFTFYSSQPEPGLSDAEKQKIIDRLIAESPVIDESQREEAVKDLIEDPGVVSDEEKQNILDSLSQ